jgi:D-lactate dehydrogenase
MSTSTNSLPVQYRKVLASILPKERILDDDLSRYAHATDASFYSLIPKLVLKVANAGELQQVMAASYEFTVPVTFRAAGTSLSGQAISDSVLITLTPDWQQHEISEIGDTVKAQPGIIGAKLNQHLSKINKKIGPDPASISSCKVGGIVANNSSGMCCGVENNSYHTLKAMSVILADGTYLDTSEEKSVKAFKSSHQTLLTGLNTLSQQVKSDKQLAELIARKFRIKNTTGYGINALLDFDDPIDILTHLMVGSEGTLGFIADVTLKTIDVSLHAATGLYVFSSISNVTQLISQLKECEISAIELMDSRALKSVKSKFAEFSLEADFQQSSLALLIEVQGSDAHELERKLDSVNQHVLAASPKYQIDFTLDQSIRQSLWGIRKGLFPIIGANREIGTTVIIEDVAFELDNLEAGIIGLTRLFEQYGYDDAIIFGHALDGNLHFAFSQSFNNEQRIDTYKQFMDDVVQLVSVELNGSLKAEHGTGRNMAPFVSKEWGRDAYQVMQKIKTLFDPKGILNPDVIISSDPEIHLKNLKALPAINNEIDRCIECGFCESVCPSKDLTLTPRQRIAVQRRMQSLRTTESKSLDSKTTVSNIEADYQYAGIDSCAATGMCSQQCPVGINTGEYVKALRTQRHALFTQRLAVKVASHYNWVLQVSKFCLWSQSLAVKLIGQSRATNLGKRIRALSHNKLPLWHGRYPSLAKGIGKSLKPKSTKVVVFQSCASRVMGPEVYSAHAEPFTNACEVLFAKAGFEISWVSGSNDCCGQPFTSGGFNEAAQHKKHSLQEKLKKAKQEGAKYLISDTTPCTLQINAPDSPIQLLDLADFIAKHILPKLHVDKLLEPIALHVTCSSTRMGTGDALRQIASACSDQVVESGVECCGFAGSKGFTLPELNASALKEVKPAEQGCRFGISQSRTCEIGLSHNTGIEYQSFVYLLNKLSRPHQR